MDRTSGVPAFRQMATSLRERISAGEFAPGAQLPSERELIESYAVSRPTVRDALAHLRNEGVVVSEHGKGVFVRPPATVHRLSRSRLSRQARERNQGAFLADAAAQGFTPSSSVKIRFESADDRTAGILAIRRGQHVTVRDRVMRADGLVVQLAVSRLPRTLTRGTAIEKVDTGPGGAYARLEDAGHVIDNFAETVGTRMPTPEEMSTLQLPSGTPVLTITRVAYDTAGQPLEVNDMTLAGDRYELTYEFPSN